MPGSRVRSKHEEYPHEMREDYDQEENDISNKQIYTRKNNDLERPSTCAGRRKVLTKNEPQHMAETASSIKNFEGMMYSNKLTQLLSIEEKKMSEQLLIASEKGNRRAAYLLLHQEIDRTRCRGMRGFTPLHHAGARGHLELIHLLLDFGWRVDITNDLEETALHLACYGGHLSVVECLLDRGANINALTKDDETPLFFATRKNHYRVVRLLIRREADLSVKNRFGDVAEEEASSERTLNEFHVGKEDFARFIKGKGIRDKEARLGQALRETLFSFLDVRSLCFASQVCYRWHRAADNPSLWRKLGVSRWELSLGATMGIGLVAPMSGFRPSIVSSLSLSASSNFIPRRPSSSNDTRLRSFVENESSQTILRKGSFVSVSISSSSSTYSTMERPHTARVLSSSSIIDV